MRSHVLVIPEPQSGDRRHTFNPDDATSVAQAMQVFNEQIWSGRVAFDRNRPPPQKLQAFDPNAQETIFVRHMQGG